jgi:hypothetical protein
MLPTIGSSGEFEVDPSMLVVARFVLDSQIGQRDLSVYDLEAVFLGNF